MPGKPTKYSVEVVVRVWRNVKTWGIVPTSHFGHASVEVFSKFVGGAYQHVSFWPGDYASKGNAILKQSSSTTPEPLDDEISEMNKLTALRLEVGYCTRNGIAYPPEWDEYLREYNKSSISAPRAGQNRLGVIDRQGLPRWSQSPDVKTYLPGFGAQGRFWGLSTGRMYKWWTNFQTSQPKYQALGRQNCAGVALMALQAGGSGAISDVPKITVYGEPVQVEEYATGLATRFDKMETLANELDQDIKQAVISGKIKSAPSDKLVDGLWTLATWKQNSALGGLTIRSTTLRQIDDAVDRYHKANWDDGYEKRYKALVDMFLALCKHRQEKPDSKRSEGLLRLGAQILSLTRNIGRLW